MHRPDDFEIEGTKAREVSGRNPFKSPPSHYKNVTYTSDEYVKYGWTVFLP